MTVTEVIALHGAQLDATIPCEALQQKENAVVSCGKPSAARVQIGCDGGCLQGSRCFMCIWCIGLLAAGRSWCLNCRTVCRFIGYS